MARNRKAKDYASIARQQGPSTAVPTPDVSGVGADLPPVQYEPPPALEPWVEGDLKLRQLAKRIETDYLAFCDLAKEAMEQGWHTRFGYVDPGDYFEERIGLSWRTLRRRFTILEAIARLPQAEQAEARSTMVELGSHKAAALAPLVREDGADWRKAAEFAKTATEEAVQSMVSEKLGRPHRGLPASQHPGERFMTWLLNVVPPETHDQVEFVFEELMKIGGIRNPIGVFLTLVDLGEVELAGHGVIRDGR